MEKYQEYSSLEVWKLSRELVKMIYDLTKDFPREELFGLSSQLRRSAVSIPSNIAEGCGRKTPSDIMHFLYIARGSVYEVETQLYLAYDQNYINKDSLNLNIRQIENVKKLLNGFINYFKKLSDSN